MTRSHACGHNYVIGGPRSITVIISAHSTVHRISFFQSSYKQNHKPDKILSAVQNVVHQVQEATGIGKGDSEHKQEQDVQQETDQAPAGAGEEGEATPEFTTTQKETLPSGEEHVVTTHDDVPIPEQEEAPTKPQSSTDSAPPQQAAEDTTPAAQQPQPSAAQPKPSAPKSAAPSSAPQPQEKADTPAAIGPMNQMANMGAGSVGLPKTRHSWKTQHDVWYPDAAGVLHVPNFYINKRRNQGLAA